MFSLYPFCRFLSSFGKTLFSPLFPTPKNEKAKAPLWHGAFLSDFRLNAPLGLPLGLKEKQHADGNAQGIKPGRNAQDQPRRTDDHGGKQNHHDNQRHHQISGHFHMLGRNRRNPADHQHCHHIELFFKKKVLLL